MGSSAPFSAPWLDGVWGQPWRQAGGERGWGTEQGRGCLSRADTKLFLQVVCGG